MERLLKVENGKRGEDSTPGPGGWYMNVYPTRLVRPPCAAFLYPDMPLELGDDAFLYRSWSTGVKNASDLRKRLIVHSNQSANG